jgi:hypothetical protein
MQSATILVGAAATKLVGSGAAIPGGQRVLLKNRHATDKVLIGGPGVTAASGFSIDAGATLDLGGYQPGLDIGGTETALYGIRGGSADISVEVLALP